MVSLWKTSWGGCPPTMEEAVKKNSMSGWWCGACGQPYDRRKLNRLQTLQFGNTVKEQLVLLAHRASDGECDNMISALKRFTNSVEGNKLSVEVNGPTESSRERLVDALANFISVESARALVTMRDVAQFKRST